MEKFLSITIFLIVVFDHAIPGAFQGEDTNEYTHVFHLTNMTVFSNNCCIYLDLDEVASGQPDICDFHSSIDSWLCSNDDSEYNVKMSLQKCDNHSSVECENSENNSCNDSNACGDIIEIEYGFEIMDTNVQCSSRVACITIERKQSSSPTTTKSTTMTNPRSEMSSRASTASTTTPSTTTILTTILNTTASATTTLTTILNTTASATTTLTTILNATASTTTTLNTTASTTTKLGQTKIMPTITSITATTSSQSENVGKQAQEVKDKLANVGKQERISKDDVKEITNQLDSLIINLDRPDVEDVSGQEKNSILKGFPKVLRRLNFSPNSSRKLQLTTKSFIAQVELADTNRSFVYEPNATETDGGKISIPSDVLKLIASKENGSSDVVVVIVKYFNPTLFPSNQSVSSIFSIDIGKNENTSLKNLSTPVQISFADIQQAEKKNLTCVYWDLNLSKWLTDGCRLSQQSPPSCECDHTTNFALLVNPNLPNDLALSIVSKIGFALSIAGLLTTLLAHIVYRELRRRRPSIILMHICFNLCVGYIIFLAGVENASWNKNLCITTAFFLQVFFLASWGWMTVYSYDVYVSLIKVFDNNRRYFLRKFGGAAYAMAVLVSVITVSVGLSLDRDTEEKYSYLSENGLCWLAKYPLLIGFFSPIAIMLCFNQTVFALIFRELFGKSDKASTSSAVKRTIEQQFIIAVTMVCFTGLAWIFAFLLLASDLFNSQGYETVFSWLFVIFNTLQGLGLFILTMVKRKETRKVWLNPLRSTISSVFSNVHSSFKANDSYKSNKVFYSSKNLSSDRHSDDFQ